MRPTDVFALASPTCVLAALLTCLPGIAWLRRRWPAVAVPVALALPLVPLGGLPAAAYVRGVVGDLSVTTTVLLLLHLLRPVLHLPHVADRSRLALQVLVATGGLLLYPMTLGSGPVDPYRLGFAHAGFVTVLLLLATGAWLARLHFVASVLALAVLAWAMGARESRNLWDSLLDPLVAAWGLGAVLWRLGRHVARKRRRFFGYASAPLGGDTDAPHLDRPVDPDPDRTAAAGR